VGPATDDSMSHVHCMLHNSCYPHTGFNTYCFSTTVVARKRLNVSLYVYIACLVAAGIDVAVGNMEVCSVALKMQQWVPFALLSTYRIFRTVVNNNEYKCSDCVCLYSCLNL
jgi:hypothetical protein